MVEKMKRIDNDAHKTLHEIKNKMEELMQQIAIMGDLFQKEQEKAKTEMACKKGKGKRPPK